MAYSTPAGTKFYVSSTFASAKTISALTNANPASATSTSHGYSTNDEVVLTSGWEDVTDTVFKVTSVDANTFTLQGLDASNTNIYAAGAGTGSARKISGWVEIPQVLSISPSGGDGKNITVSPLGRRQGLLLPDGFNPASNTLTLGYDPSQSNWSTLMGLSRTTTLVAYKQVRGNGNVTYGYGYIQIAEQVTQQSGSADTVACQILLQGRPIAYVS